MSIVIGAQSGVLLGFMEASEPGDHPDHQAAAVRSRELDTLLSTYQQEARAARLNDSLSNNGKRERIRESARARLDRLENVHRAFLKVARMHAGEAEWKLQPRDDPRDQASLMRAIEIRRRFERMNADQRITAIRQAMDRHDERDTQFLQALLADPDYLNLIPPAILARVGRWLLEANDPAAFRRWKRLVEQLDRYEEAVEAAEVYLISDTDITDAERRERDRDEEIRRRIASSARIAG